MTRSKRFKLDCLDDDQIQNLKKILGHIGLYVGLVIYTALGAWIFQMIEHPVEEAKLTTLQDLVMNERENFINLVFNMTAHLNEEELAALESYVNNGESLETNDYSVRTIMLSTNRLPVDLVQQLTGSPRVDDVIQRVDEALLNYEQTVAVAAGEGIDVVTKEIYYQWTYVQTVFFASTIITTVGYGNMAPVTTSGRAFCILFAIIGMPFTLSVIADIGQILATLVSTVWGKTKPIIMPQIDKLIAFKKKVMKKRRRMKSGGSGADGKDPEGDGDGANDEDEEEEEDDPMQSMGIAANVVMAFVSFGFLCVFLSMGSYVFTLYEDWTFFDAFYFCFITMTTIGFGDIVPSISADKTSYMLLCMIYILVGLGFTSTIIELVRRQYAESWRKMQELRAQIQAQLKLADHLRKMGEQGKDLEGMDVDLNQLRANLSKFKRYGKGFDINDLDWMDPRRKIKAVTIFFYETSV